MSLRSRITPVASALAGLALVVAGVPPVQAQPDAAPEAEASLATDAGGAASAPSAQSEWAGVDSDTGLWIVQLDEPSIAAYQASFAEESRQAEAADGRDAQLARPDVEGYRSQLEQRHAQVRADISRALGRTVEAEFTYLNVLNAMAVRADLAEAEQLRGLPGVAEVYPDLVREIETDVSHDIILSDAIWSGDNGNEYPTRGEGVIVGMLDTGVNPFHPSFAAVDGEGYEHINPFGSGNYVGVCDPAHPNQDDICNDKLIGAWNFHPTSPSARDVDSHGSHVGSTIAGNIHDAVFELGGTEFTRTIQGVAPRANVISYLVCFPGCPSTSSVAAVNQAIDDGTHVLNYSISGSDSPWTDPVDLAFLDAYGAGVIVVASAGNTGPGASTAAKSGPWNSSVAATTHYRVFAVDAAVTGPTPVPPALASMPAFPGSGPQVTSDLEAEVRDAVLVAPGNALGCSPFPAGSFDGAVALIERGTCTFETKVVNAAAAGAIAVLMRNNVGGPPISAGGLETTTIPAVMLDDVDGSTLSDFIADTAPDPTTISIAAGAEVIDNDDWTDIVAGFSSRGPSQFEMLLPTFAAPGVNILAAAHEQGGDPNQYLVTQGTSMSSPHGAGSAALLRALHPNWTPSEIRSALASTADYEDLFKEDGTTATDPFDIGSGRVNLDQAGRIGLVMDETHANFVAANPAIGGDPKTLNLPAMVDMDCVGVCSWERTVKHLATVPATYTAVVDAPEGVSVTVEPETFDLTLGTLNGDTQDVTITVDVSGAEVGAWQFARVHFVTDTLHPAHGDFVQLWETDNLSVTWTEHDVDLRAYAGQEVCLGFSYTGLDAHSWTIDDVLITSAAGTHLDEGFAGEDFPPAGWSRYDFDGVGSEWARVTTPVNSDPGAARHAFSSSASGLQQGWLVTPSFTLGVDPEFSFFSHVQFPGWYGHSAVWISTGDCDPTPTGDGLPFAATQYPIAVIPAPAPAQGPEITVDPDELSSTQPADTQVTEMLTIGNVGDADLEWEILTEGGAVPVTLSHSNSDTITALNSVACSPDGGFSTTDNGYLRHFALPDLGVSGDFAVTEVTFGVEVMRPSAQTLTVNLYQMIDPDGPFVYANFEAIGSTDVTVPPVELELITVPITADVDADATLVVEVDAPHFNGAAAFFIGSNNLGQTAPSYLRSATCGFVEPTDTAGIAAQMQMVMSVTGTTDAGDCEIPDWLAVDPSSGTVAPDGTQAVEVTFDSTGLADGTYEGTLCVASNDSVGNTLVQVPVTLVVEGDPVLPPTIEVDPEFIESTQAVDTVTEHTLTISNVGEADLEWEITEAESDPGNGDGNGPLAPLVLPQGADRGSAQPETSGPAPAVVTPANVPLVTELTEGFDDITTLPGAGWAMQNNSEPVGSTGWFQGNPAVFPAHEGEPNAYIAANFNNAGTSPGNISNWLLTPELTLTNGSEFSFWTRSVESDFADRLEVRLSTSGDSTDVGTGYNGVGDFTDVLVTINEALAPNGYPTVWTEFVITVDELDAPTTGRIGLRYFVPNGGPLGNNSDYIGIDTVSYVAADEPVPPHACEVGTDIPWLSASPIAGTTAPGESSEVIVSIDSTGLDLGEYTADLCVASNDPANPLVLVPVTLTVTDTPPEPESTIEGTVTGESCDGVIAPLAGATVTFSAEGVEDWSVITDQDGFYTTTFTTIEGPVTVTVTAEGYEPDSTEVTVGPDQTAVVDFTLLEADCPVDPEITVERWFGDDRYETAVAISGQHEPGVDAVFVASGLDYADALAASALAGSWEVPVLLTRNNHLPAATAAELDRLEPGAVYVLGDVNAINDAVATAIGVAAGAEVTRLEGPHRYATAAAIAEQFDTAEVVYIATGQDFADALAGGARAGALDGPVLLVRPDHLPAATAGQLERLEPDSIRILGDTNSVNADVEALLATYGEVTRYPGDDRYHTAVLISEDYDSAQTVWLASGQNWPDALAGAARAGADHEPLLLAQLDNIPNVTWDELLRLQPERVVLFGDTNTLNQEDVEDRLHTLYDPVP